MKHEQSIDWQNIYYKLEESDKTVGRIQELAEKMSKVSGYEIEGCIKDTRVLSEDPDWDFLVCKYSAIQLASTIFSKNSQVSEQQLDDRIKEMSESFNELVDSGKYREEDMKNCKTSLEESVEESKDSHVECCEGGDITAGCFHDNCTGSVLHISTPCLEDVTTWKCFKQVADVLGEEHAEYELKKVLQGYYEGIVETEDGGDLVQDPLIFAFDWSTTHKSSSFWSNINDGILPKDYHTTPDVPSYNPSNNKLEERVTEAPLETHSQSVGELVEELYSKLLPSDVTISINGNGQILLHSNTTPVVDVSKLSAEDIDKAYEALVMLEGCFVEYNESKGE